MMEYLFPDDYLSQVNVTQVIESLSHCYLSEVAQCKLLVFYARTVTVEVLSRLECLRCPEVLKGAK